MMPPPLTLIGGWGASVAMIKHWVHPISDDVPCVGLDDALVARASSLETAADHLLPELPGRHVLVGWSLGGQVAMAAAARAPEKIAGIITVCSTPCFVACPDWPYGMPASIFAAFAQGIERSPERQWRGFMRLQIRGGVGEASGRRRLQPWLDKGLPVSQASLLQSLTWLEKTDQRELWQAPPVPTRHLFGRGDELVSPEVATWLRTRKRDACCVDGMSHWPFGDVVRQVTQEVEDFSHAHAGS